MGQMGQHHTRNSASLAQRSAKAFLWSLPLVTKLSWSAVVACVPGVRVYGLAHVFP